MDLRKLIHCVKQYTFLYDWKDRLPLDFERKDVAWKEIGEAVNSPPSECKKQWTYLRDSFRRVAKKRRECKSVAAMNKLKKWKFEDEMSFLLPHIKEREAASPSDRCDSEVEGSLGNNWESSPGQQPESESTLSKKTLRKKRSSPQTPSEDARRNRREDDIDIFFRGLAATVKKLSRYNQAIAKSKTFSVISELEIEEAAQIDGVQSPHSSRFAVSSSDSRQPYFSNELNSRPLTDVESVCVKSEPLSDD